MSMLARQSDRLRRCLLDMVALSAMPVAWMDRELRQIGEEMADALLRILQLDFIYLRIKVQTGEDFIEIARASDPSNNLVDAGAVGEKLIQGILSDGNDSPSISNPVGDGSVRLATSQISNDGPCGMLVAGSGQPGFPTEEDRLLLNVGANQLAFMLQRLHAEQALREREQTRRQMAAIVESSNDAIIGSSFDGKIESWNPGAERLFGYSAEEVISKSAALLFPPELLGNLSEMLERVRSGERIRDYETVRLHKNGKRIDVSISISPINDENKVVTGVSVIARDITERHQAERRRRAWLAVTEVLARAPTFKWAAVRVLQVICENLGWDVGALWNFDREAQVMRCVELWHNPSLDIGAFEADSRQLTFAEGAGLPGRVWASRKVAWIQDVRLDANFARAPIADTLGLHSAFSCPIILGEQVLGTIEFFSREIREPDADLLEMMASIGGQIGQFMERKWAEEAVRESDARYRAVVESDVVGVIFWHVDGRLLDCNGYAARMLGYSVDEIRSGQVIWKTIIPPEHIDRDRQKTRDVIHKGKTISQEKEFIRKDGSRVPVLVAGAAHMGDPDQGLAVVVDISDLKRAEQEVLRLLAYEHQQKTRQHRVAEVSLEINSALSMEDVLRIITDEAREIIGAHQSVSSVSRNREWAQAITAVSLSDKYGAWRAYDEKPDGSGIYALVCETNRPLRLTQSALEAHPRWRGFGAHAGKHPPLNGWLAVPFIGSKGQNLGLIQLSDKYEGEFTEEDEDILIQLAHMAAFVIENSHLYDELRQADRTKDEFLALVSHEIRNPLNAILGWTQLARAAKSNEALISRALETIERNTRIQAKLIEDLLDVSRILRGKLKVDKSPVEIAPVIQASLDAARPVARAKSINLRDTIDYSTGVVIGDSDRLQQIVLNLLNNAIKFTPEGGRVDLRLERIEEPAGRPCAQLTVSDTGVGMSDEFLPYVFDPFRQADSSTTKRQAGLGLGLAIVRHMVEMHGGIVEAKSAGKNQGSTFIVKLPLAESSQSFPGLKTPIAPRGHIPPAIEHNALQGLYVLIVDDHLDTRVSLAIGLKSYGAEIEACSSVAEAMEALQRRLPDLILSDIGMPDEDGYALIKKVRAMEPNRGGRIPAIALTGYAGDESRQQLLAAGFHIHIPKPTDIPSLVKRILDAIESTRMNNGIVSRQPD